MSSCPNQVRYHFATARYLEEVGLEPTKPVRVAGLQPAGFAAYPTLPCSITHGGRRSDLSISGPLAQAYT